MQLSVVMAIGLAAMATMAHGQDDVATTEILSPSVARIEIEGTGPTAEPEHKVASAVIISEDGYALTAAHNFYYKNNRGSDYVGVPTMKASLEVASGPLQNISFAVVDQDSRFALIKLRMYQGIAYRPANLCFHNSLQRGSYLWAAGFPYGEEFQVKRGTFDSPNGPQGMWQTGISASPGYSGGPVALEDGSVVGIVEGALVQGNAGTRVMPINQARSLAMAAGLDVKRCREQQLPSQAQRSMSWQLGYVSQQIERLYAPLNLKLQKGESEWSQFQEDFNLRFGRRSPTQYIAGKDNAGNDTYTPLPMKDDEWNFWIASVQAIFKPHNDSIEQLVSQNAAFLDGGAVPECYQEFLRHSAAFNASLSHAQANPATRIWNPKYSWPSCFVPETAAMMKKLSERQNAISATLNAPISRPDS